MGYKLTDEQIDRLMAVLDGCLFGADRKRSHTREWFASLPVVSREAAERALGEVTKEEAQQAAKDFNDCRASTSEQRDIYTFNRFLVRRRAMLDAAPVGPPKPEAKPSVASVYLVPDPNGDGFRVRAKGDGQTDPEVDHVTAAEILGLVRSGR